ncbi:hypothetical protein [Pseudomonas aeruginosa]
MYKNLRNLKDRMLAASYSYESVERYVRFLAGEHDGWNVLRMNWGEQFNPADHVKAKVPDFPDLGWLVGSPDHGTGWLRNETALDIWHAEIGEPRPGEKKTDEQQEQEHAAWLAKMAVQKAEQHAATAKASKEIAALKAAHEAAPAPVAKPNKFKQQILDDAAKKVAAQATQQPASAPAEPCPRADASEVAEPVLAPAQVPESPVVQANHVPPVPAKVLPTFDDEERVEPSFASCQEWWKAAMAGKHARDIEAAKKAALKLTAHA